MTATPGFFEQVRSYSKPYWYAVGMEMIERWAYYGVRAVLALYIVGAVNLGGLGFNHIQKGNIYLWWAIIASFLPMFTGGLADRYGYKRMVALAVGVKVVGYGLMATQTEYWSFFAGCMLLAAGTGLFKPGVQGLIAHSVTPKTASLGWGIFYEMVNLGAFVGIFLAPHLRGVSWDAIFYVNTVLVALNFLPLLMFKEPDVARPPKHASVGAALAEMGGIFKASLKDLFQPRLFAFVAIFAGFWFSYHQLFDLLPNFIEDWVTLESTPAIFTANGAVAPESLINLNSFLILVLMIPVAFIASKFNALRAICFGIFVSIVGLLAAGYTQSGTAVAVGIAIFTFGEMLASPRTKDYMTAVAPREKLGAYLGYSEVPSGLGWALGSIVAGGLYEHQGDKTNFARALLQEKGVSAEAVAAIPKEKVMESLAEKLGVSVPEATRVLWNLHSPQNVWWIFAGVGLASLVGLVVYDQVMRRLAAREQALVATVPSAEAAGVSLAKAQHTYDATDHG